MQGREAQVVDIVRRLFRPAVRFCVRRSITLSPVVEILKSLFVEAALEELTARSEKPAVSRLSVMSGVTRREVQRILAAGTRDDQPISLLSRVLNRWEQDNRFTTRDRQPKILSYQGEENEFRALVASVTKDVSAGTVLAELIRVGAVETTARGLKMVTGLHDQTESEDRILALLIRNLETLTDAAEENAYRPGETRNLHTRTEYDNIAPEALPEIRRWFMDRGLELHRAAREFLSQYDLDINPEISERGGAKVALGTFSLTTVPTEQGAMSERKKMNDR